MTDHSDAVAGRLENGSVLLAWGDDALYVTNKLSGSTRRFSFPAFALRIGGKDLTPEDFSLILRQEEAQEQVFVYRCDRAGISSNPKTKVLMRLKGSCASGGGSVEGVICVAD